MQVEADIDFVHVYNIYFKQFICCQLEQKTVS